MFEARGVAVAVGADDADDDVVAVVAVVAVAVAVAVVLVAAAVGNVFARLVDRRHESTHDGHTCTIKGRPGLAQQDPWRTGDSRNGDSHSGPMRHPGRGRCSCSILLAKLGGC